MNKQNGFTLIELVVVIIILGILAVTAAPKFINLQSDARASTVQGVKGALQGANTLVYSKAAIQGKENTTGTVIIDDLGDADDTNDITVTTAFGNLDSSATVADVVINLEKALDMQFQALADDTTVVTTEEWGVRSTATTFKLVPQGKTASSTAADACHLLYTQAGSVSQPAQYAVVDTGC
ncbi:prepilin-type N-terminal cleavage/methylation domain-containing protein [Shewanella sp. Scap07]|uniref:prepilin-type N-terminal cleavage/methylation domain-containing protein n=1 Tax=Shewanella sp. Scap07 TaxID=2589987 RepID=UPI0015C0CF2C|nr:prepilin-type N-terminal cleavage/methylation domain-containing protein [Shewanella sp. Scap07]QLE87083.1 prepilin-type N-terminal cleavage/methylation domain-containing protein [Shewanella sp. Scap07]